MDSIQMINLQPRQHHQPRYLNRLSYLKGRLTRGPGRPTTLDGHIGHARGQSLETLGTRYSKERLQGTSPVGLRWPRENQAVAAAGLADHLSECSSVDYPPGRKHIPSVNVQGSPMSGGRPQA